MKMPWSKPKVKNQYYLKLESELNLVLVGGRQESGVMVRVEKTDVIEAITDEMYKAGKLSRELNDLFHEEMANRNMFKGFIRWYNNDHQFQDNPSYLFTGWSSGIVYGGVERKNILMFGIKNYYTIVKKEPESTKSVAFDLEIDVGGILKSN